MGLHMKQNENRSELQQRLDAELRRKAAERAKRESEHPDGVEDSKYIEGTKQTTSLAWAWILILIAAIGLFAFFVYRSFTLQ